MILKATVLIATLLQTVTFVKSDQPGLLISALSHPTLDRRSTAAGPPAFLRAVAAVPSSGPPSCLHKYGPLCGDCNSLWTCVGAAEPVLVQNCDETHPGRPLCERNACTASVPATSGCATELQCTGQGYFPNPINCRRYYFCAGAGGPSLVYECPMGFVYNSTTSGCRRRRAASDCVQVDCGQHINRYAEYAADPRLYAFCLQRLGVLAPVMLRCPGTEHRFDEPEQRCVFECPHAGRFADDADPLAYFECLPHESGGGDWIVLHQRCRPGFGYAWWWQRCLASESSSWNQQTFYEGATERVPTTASETSTVTSRATATTTTTTTTTTTPTSVESATWPTTILTTQSTTTPTWWTSASPTTTAQTTPTTTESPIWTTEESPTRTATARPTTIPQTSPTSRATATTTTTTTTPTPTSWTTASPTTTETRTWPTRTSTARPTTIRQTHPTTESLNRTTL